MYSEKIYTKSYENVSEVIKKPECDQKLNMINTDLEKKFKFLIIKRDLFKKSSISLLSLSTKGQTDWKPQSQKG